MDRDSAESALSTIVHAACREHDYSDEGHRRFMFLINRAIDWFKKVTLPPEPKGDE